MLNNNGENIIAVNLKEVSETGELFLDSDIFIKKYLNYFPTNIYTYIKE